MEDDERLTPHGAASFGRPWVALTLALGLHVADEALNDFLSVYNPTVAAIRARLPFMPLPSFTFEVWLAGLVTAVMVLLATSPLAFRGARPLRPVAYALGTLMLANGLGHVVASLVTGRLIPGVYSSPVLLAAALWLLVMLRRTSPREGTTNP